MAAICANALSLIPSERQRLFDLWLNRCRVQGECIVWQGGRKSADEGYGVISFRGQMWRAHRLFFWILHRRQPVGLVRHLCGNAACVNPDHLADGTHSDNLRDAYAMGRRPRRRKLTTDQKKQIARLADNYTGRTIADWLKLPESTVNDELRRVRERIV